MEVEAIDRKIFIRGLEGAILVNWGVRLIHKSFYVDFFVRKNDLFLIRKEGVDVPKEVPGLITGENVEIIPFVMLEKSERKYFFFTQYLIFNILISGVDIDNISRRW